MADRIPAEIVTETWQWMAQTPIHEAPDLVNQMQQEQPAIVAHDEYRGLAFIHLKIALDAMISSLA